MRKILALLLAGITIPSVANAAVDSGDTAWILTSTALVLLMIPGLAFFYAGMVRSKNVVSTLYINLIALSLLAITWAVVGYSLAFSNGNSFVGDFSNAFLAGIGMEPSEGSTIPAVLFVLFQMMFAIITPILMTGSLVERISMRAWLFIMVAWSVVVYSPVCHWVWSSTGWIAQMGGTDFAGGYVVHMTAGFSALTAAALIGKRKDFGKDLALHDVGMVALGTGLLWFGWFGFNGGSALAADGAAANAIAVTMLSAAGAFLSWLIVDLAKTGKAGLVGGCIGAVVGLVVATPAAGAVTPMAGLLMGLAGGAICNLAAGFVKESLKIDDSLDVFACHGVGGLFGILCVGLFASENIGGTNGLFNGGDFSVFATQATGALGVAVYSVIATTIIVKLVGIIVPLRSADVVEDGGLDEADHGEKINSLV